MTPCSKCISTIRVPTRRTRNNKVSFRTDSTEVEPQRVSLCVSPCSPPPRRLAAATSPSEGAGSPFLPPYIHGFPHPPPDVLFNISAGRVGKKRNATVASACSQPNSGKSSHDVEVPPRSDRAQLGELGKGAGKGGGGGGSVRAAGGAFGKREVAEEERYFRQKEKEQMEALRKHHVEEIEHHKKEIERLQKEIDRHKGKIRKLNHDD
uniref:ATP synthase inhibitory factor subunit 1a n=1 Tax=Gasterosteus aculeatus aculeatus TaxID=481459 RepID=A0AAQ4P0M5_GASAC